MSMKKYLPMLLAMSAMGVNLPQTYDRRSRGNGFGEGNKPPIPKGAQEYNFPGFTCVAMNEKSANKKYQKFLSKNK